MPRAKDEAQITVREALGYRQSDHRSQAPGPFVSGRTVLLSE